MCWCRTSRRGAAERLGLSYRTQSRERQHLIVCDISGYGNDGPYRDKKAYDLLIQAESGFVSITGTADQPSKAGCSIADIAAGMYAYTNILAALLQRNKTDRGAHIDISMLESMVEWMSYPLYYAYEDAAPPPRAGASHATIFPYGPFQAGDGKTVILGLQNEREWAVFCRVVLEQPGLASDPRFATNALRAANREALTALIHAAFAGLMADAVVERLERAQIANAHMNGMRDVWRHPQLEARSRWTAVPSPIGPIPALYPPGLPGAFAPRMDGVTAGPSWPSSAMTAPRSTASPRPERSDAARSRLSLSRTPSRFCDVHATLSPFVPVRSRRSARALRQGAGGRRRCRHLRPGRRRVDRRQGSRPAAARRPP